MRYLTNVIDFLNKLVDMIFISFLWIIFSIPVITIGASSAALYHTTQKSIDNDSGRLFSIFFKSFCENLKNQFKVQFMLISLTIILGSTLLFCLKMEPSEMTLFYLVFNLSVLIVVILIQIHLYALIGRFCLTYKQILSMIMQLLRKNILHNLLLLSLFIFSVQLIIYYPPLCLFVPSGYTFLALQIQEPVFKIYIRVVE